MKFHLIFSVPSRPFFSVVKNLNKSIEFYEHLGLKLWKREIESGSFISKVVGLKKAVIEIASQEGI